MSNFEFIISSELFSPQVSKTKKGYKAAAGDSQYEIIRTDNNNFQLLIDGITISSTVAYDRGVYYVEIDSHLFEVAEAEQFQSSSTLNHATEKDKIFAPMPGKLVKLMVKVGDRVKENQPVAIVEAMKMENQVVAFGEGVVKAVNCAEGDQVDTDSPIIELDLKE